MSFGLAGCASTAAGLLNSPPVSTYSSRSTPEHVAACVTLSLNGNSPSVKDGDDHYVVTRQNGFGRPVVRIDVVKEGVGSKIEVRRSVPFNTGLSKIRDCAES